MDLHNSSNFPNLVQAFEGPKTESETLRPTANTDKSSHRAILALLLDAQIRKCVLPYIALVKIHA